MLPLTLMGRIVQFLFQVNMTFTILVFSALMLSPLVSHHFVSVDGFFGIIDSERFRKIY